MIHVSWDNCEQTIIKCQFNAGWSFNDLHDALDTIYVMMELVTHESYVIFDMLEANTLPSVKLSNFKAATIKAHPRVRMFVDVTTSVLIIRMTKLFKEVYPNTLKIELVKTLDDAYQVIHDDITSIGSA